MWRRENYNDKNITIILYNNIVYQTRSYIRISFVLMENTYIIQYVVINLWNNVCQCNVNITYHQFLFSNMLFIRQSWKLCKMKFVVIFNAWKIIVNINLYKIKHNILSTRNWNTCIIHFYDICTSIKMVKWIHRARINYSGI